MTQENHWQQVYEHKPLEEASWYEPVPETSLQLITGLHLAKDAALLDIGGGDSLLVDALLDLGYVNITVLDISRLAIERAQKRLGPRAGQVKWLVSDMLSLPNQAQYDLWHDRAAFHFLTDPLDQHRYRKAAHEAIKPGGFLILSSFAPTGPKTCSGLPVQGYSKQSMARLFATDFRKLGCLSMTHHTPFQTQQHFTYCSFKNKSSTTLRPQ